MTEKFILLIIFFFVAVRVLIFMDKTKEADDIFNEKKKKTGTDPEKDTFSSGLSNTSTKSNSATNNKSLSRNGF